MAGDFDKVQTARQELLDESEKLNVPLGWVDPQEVLAFGNDLSPVAENEKLYSSG
jgi:hypothetical protein